MADLSALKQSVQDAYNQYKEKKISPVTYSGNQEIYEPEDVSKNIETRSAFSKYRGLESDYLKKRWYGEQEANANTLVGGEPEKGLIGRGLEALLIPSKFTTGVVKNIVGQGTESDPLSEGAKNIEVGDTMGTLLRNAGAPEIISMPMGFLLDVATDPLNIAMAGTGGIIGKVLAGSQKAGLKGALKGAESSLKTGAGKLALMTPKFNKTELAGKVVQGALKSSDEFDNLVGETYLTKLAKKPAMASAFENVFGKSAGEAAHSSIIKVVDGVFGAGKGDNLIDFFQYSPSKWYKASKFIDELEKVDKNVVKVLKEMPLMERKNAITDIFKSVENGSYESLASKVARTDAASSEPAFRLSREVEDAKQVAAEASEPVNFIDSMSGNQRLNAMVQEASNDAAFRADINTILESKKDFYRTGFKAYDNLVDKVNKFTLPVDVKMPEIAKKIGIKSENLNQIKFGKAILDTYGSLISLFKASKVSVLSPASVMNAISGNPIMAHLAGINILDPDYITGVAKANSFLSGKLNKEFVKDFFLSGKTGGQTLAESYPWIEFMRKYPRTFTATYGFSPEFFKYKYSLVDQLDKAFKLGILKTGDEASAVKAINEVAEMFSKKDVPSVAGDVIKGTINKTKEARIGFPSAVKTEKQMSEDWLAKGIRPIEGWETPQQTLEYYTSFAANELGNAQFEKISSYVRNKANSGDRAYKFVNLLLNDSRNGYERIDQSFKLGLAYKLSSKGITENELMTLRKFVNIAPEDVLAKIKSGAEYKYLLSPERATEAVNFVYMNYNAMPAFVKFVRSMPLAGSPFFSFMYAMADKTGKSILMNPASFNKISLLMKEMNGAASPLEKESLDSEYNKYMKSEGMVRLPFPFFDNNPLYINTINWLPYYMNNIFSGSDKTYEGQFPNELSKLIDSSPLMQDPVGQMLFNYFIQPMILDGEIPQGRFGQQIYPTDATTAEKVAYFSRDLAEMFVPSAAAATSMVIPDEAINWLPNYHWRRLSNAIKGRTVIGADAKDPAAERTIKAISSVLGLPLYSPNLEYTVKDNNK